MERNEAPIQTTSPGQGGATGSSVEAGWQVHDWAGDLIGVVTDVTPDSLVVRLNTLEANAARIPVALIEQGDASGRVVRLAVATSELEEVRPRTDVRLVG